MTQVQSLISEMEAEAQSTKALLEMVPAEHFSYQPHEKSMDLKKLATHIASLQGVTAAIASMDSYDLADLQIPEMNSAQDLVALQQEGLQKSIEAMKQIQDADLEKPFEMFFHKRSIMKAPKGPFLRRMAMSHLYHHRAQLGVYLRMLDVPIPGMYGPSADDRAKVQ